MESSGSSKLKPSSPSATKALTAGEILEGWTDHSTRPGKRSLEIALRQGDEEGRWQVAGLGKKNDPFRYRRPGEGEGVRPFDHN